MPLYTSESVSSGHPDKVADLISDAIVDAYISQDRDAKVACETLISKNLVVVAGEITSHAHVDVKKIVNRFCTDCELIVRFHKQSPELAQILGASDQCIVYGYATNETEQYMPLSIVLAHDVIKAHDLAAKNYEAIKSDAKSQVTIYRDETSCYIDSAVLSTQHSENTSMLELQNILLPYVIEALPSALITEKTRILINPAGRFVTGGAGADTGLTGRKQIVDTYGGIAHHGGGAFSGKDPSKIDRSAAYLARYIAKNLVGANLCTTCEVQLAYAIGISEPISLSVRADTDRKLEDAIYKVFDLSAEGMIDSLRLKRPIYEKTAYLGHFGRQDPDFTWEQLDKTEALRAVFS